MSHIPGTLTQYLLLSSQASQFSSSTSKTEGNKSMSLQTGNRAWGGWAASALDRDSISSAAPRIIP